MATVWIYPPEILPLKTRAKGASLAAAADFLGNFLVVEITPPALRNIGYKTYVIFAVLNVVNAIIVWAFYPETAGQTLESVDELFVGHWEDERVVGEKVPLVRKAQWGVVRRARASRKVRKEGGVENGSGEETEGQGKARVQHVEGRSD
jgi:Sugar (and other) transporter